MTFRTRRWLCLAFLFGATTSLRVHLDSSPCEGGMVIFQARYTPSVDGFSGFIELTDTVALVWIGNVSVSYPYPQLRLNDTSVEVNFTRRQEGTLRELHRRLPGVSSLEISYYCDLTEDFLCDAVCIFDDEEIDLTVEDGSGDGEDSELRELCKKKAGLAFLRRSWEKIWPHWQNVCLYLETQKPIRTNVTFRYHARDGEVRCRVSVAEPVRCKARIYNGTKALASAPCEQHADASVGASVAYRVRGGDGLTGFVCEVMGDMINDTIVSLDPNPEPSTDAPSRPSSTDGALAYRADDGVGIGLTVGLPVTVLVVATVLVVIFRRRLGLWTLDRIVNRATSRFAYRLTITKE